MKLLLFGKDGQLGWELQRSLPSLGELVAVDVNSTDMCGDFTHPNGIAETIRSLKPGAIVNAAAYTAVDKAEKERNAAMLINAETPYLIAQEACKLNALLIHYSTDYVFDGSGNTPWQETDSPSPLNTYGTTKLEGEKAIQSSGCRWLMLRTSWLYGTRGTNFIRTILRLASERDSLAVVNDQIGAPTAARLLADITARALNTAFQRPDIEGLYHVAAKGETSWYNYACFIVDLARKSGANLKIDSSTIRSIPSTDFPTPAQRPLNSRLCTKKLEQTLDLQLPPWQDSVNRTLAEILKNNPQNA